MAERPTPLVDLPDEDLLATLEDLYPEELGIFGPINPNILGDPLFRTVDGITIYAAEDPLEATFGFVAQPRYVLGMGRPSIVWPLKEDRVIPDHDNYSKVGLEEQLFLADVIITPITSSRGSETRLSPKKIVPGAEVASTETHLGRRSPRGLYRRLPE